VQSLVRLIATLVVVVALVPVQSASAANKPNWHLGDRTLKEGHKGHDVRVLQDFLARAGQRISVDGLFGPGTTRALRSFERAQRQPVDGKVTRSDVPVLRDVATNGGAIASAANTGGALPRSPLTVPAPAAAANRVRNTGHRRSKRASDCAGASTPGRPGDHRRGQRDRHQALPLRRRARQLAGHRL